jgi:uncharacterized membrane protein YtjA (UPF0391 family)
MCFPGEGSQAWYRRIIVGGQSMTPLLRWALVFLVVSLIAGLLGFTGVSVVSAEIARTLFLIFLAIFVVLLVLGLTIFRAGPTP